MEKDDEIQNEDALHPINDEMVRLLVDNRRKFRTFLIKRVESEAIADEILQQSFRKVVESPPLGEKSESVLAWFFKVLRSAIVDHYRARQSDQKKIEAFKRTLEAQGADTMSGPDEIEAEVCACMRQLLPTLKPEYAQLLERIDLGSETPEAVAADLGIKRGNLDVRLHRARLALKKSLERSCGSCTKHGCLSCTCGH